MDIRISCQQGSRGTLGGETIVHFGKKRTVRWDVFVSFDDISLLFYHLFYDKVNSSYMFTWKSPSMKI